MLRCTPPCFRRRQTKILETLTNSSTKGRKSAILLLPMICLLCKRAAVVLQPLICFQTLNPTNSVPFLCSSIPFTTVTNICATVSNQKVQTRNNADPKDAAFSLFKSYGFSDAHIDKLVEKCPWAMTVTPKILKPKLEFFREIGLPADDTGKLICSEPQLLRTSMEKRILPNFELLLPILGGKHCVRQAALKMPRLLMANVAKTLLPNIEILKKNGLAGENVADFLNVKSRLLFRRPDRLEEYVKRLKGMGYDLSIRKHIVALTVLASNSGSTWDRKMALFKSFGWTEDDILCAFGRNPNFFEVADVKLRNKLEFFTNKLRFSPAVLSSHPVLLMLSLEKRILPRCAVFNLLVSKGVKKMRMREVQLFIVGNKKFLEIYVNRYIDKLPELMDAFEGRVEFNGLELECYRQPNLETLRKYYVPEDVVKKLVQKDSRVILVNPVHFDKVIKGLKKMDFDFSSKQFVDALCALALMSDLTSKAKLSLYMSFGWSNDDFVAAFRKQPNFVTVPDEQIKKIVHVCEDSLNWSVKDIAATPSLLLLDLEESIMPRCSVFKTLVSKGALRKKKPGDTFFSMSHERFFQTYVKKYQDIVPEVLEIYKGCTKI